jgi:NTP pyrophosphatase (non-canonical NTP hydrolase)
MLSAFSRVNRERAAEWHKDGEEWSLADWSNALCGEAGELANVIKKIRRLQTGTAARYDEQDARVLALHAAAEIADVIIYADLLLEQLDCTLDIRQIVADKFNETTRKFGFNHYVTQYDWAVT